MLPKTLVPFQLSELQKEQHGANLAVSPLKVMCEISMKCLFQEKEASYFPLCRSSPCLWYKNTGKKMKDIYYPKSPSGPSISVYFLPRILHVLEIPPYLHVCPTFPTRYCNLEGLSCFSHPLKLLSILACKA